MQLTFLFLAWLVIALITHALVSRYTVATVVSAILMVVITQLASYLELGHADPFWVLSSLVALGMALIVSLVVGLPFRLSRAAHTGRGSR